MEGRQLASQAFGKLTVTKFLAQGGGGIVYETSNNDVLLKVSVPPESLSLATKKKKLADSIVAYKTFASLNLPPKDISLSCLPGEYILLDKTNPAYFMKRARGLTLHDVFRQEISAMSINQKIVLSKSIVASLKKLHSNQVVHADIKPLNFVWDKHTETVYMLDVDSGGYHGPQSSGGKFYKQFWPTAIPDAEYQSPELVNGVEWRDLWDSSGTKKQNWKRQPDLWALAVLLYEILVDKEGPFPTRRSRKGIDEYKPFVPTAFYSNDAVWPSDWQTKQMARELGSTDAAKGIIRAFQDVFGLPRNIVHNIAKTRPTADQWHRILGEFANLQTAAVVPSKAERQKRNNPVKRLSPNSPPLKLAKALPIKRIQFTQASNLSAKKSDPKVECPHCNSRFDRIGFYVLCPSCKEAVYGLATCSLCKNKDKIPRRSQHCPHCGGKPKW